MKQFRLRVNIESGRDPYEIARVLQVTAQRLLNAESFDTYRNLYDEDGAVIGYAALKDADQF